MRWASESWSVEMRGMMLGWVSDLRMAASRAGLCGGVGDEVVMSFTARGVLE